MKTALIIINYGTPDTARRRDVAHYLRQLLDNKHVMTMNSVGRKILVNCIIAPLRSRKSPNFTSGSLTFQVARCLSKSIHVILPIGCNSCSTARLMSMWR
ncbi:MAG: ferrochelatase [Bacteroidales bacterium]|nr:ferrochelatase [Bacteroidales bacterium]